MKKLLLIISLITIISSCKKSDQQIITDKWELEGIYNYVDGSIYTNDNGNILQFKNDGTLKYEGKYGVPMEGIWELISNGEEIEISGATLSGTYNIVKLTKQELYFGDKREEYRFKRK